MATKRAVHQRLETLSETEREILNDTVPGRSMDERVATQLDRRERVLARSTRGLQFRADVTRRSVLQSLGASALLAPFLTSSALRGRAQAQAAETEHDNLLIIDWPCGLEPDWTPMGTGGGYQLVDKGPGSTKYGTEPQLSDLVAAHRDKMLLLSGAQSLIETDLFAHSQGPCSMWTGSTGGKGAQALSNFASIEQQIRDKICANLPVKSIHASTLALTRPGGPSTISLPFYHWSAPQTGIEPIDDPGSLYMDLAPLLATASGSGGSAMGGADAMAIKDRMMRQKKSVIDFVSSELASAKNRVSSDDAMRLDQHLTKIRDLEQRLLGGAARGSDGLVCAAGAPPDMALTGMGAKLATNGPALVNAQAEIIALAFKCGLTKVATLQLGETDCLYQVPYEGATYILHAAAHNMGNSDDPTTRWVSSRYMADMVGQIISVFAGVDLGNGKSLLDKTLIVATSEMSLQEHVTKNMPYVIVGGSTGYFRKGEHISLDPSYRISKMVLTVMDYFGLAAQTLGEAAKVGGNTDGPLMEVRA